MSDRRRNSLVLLIVAALLAASAIVIATKPTRLGLDLKGGVSLIYKGTPTAQAKVNSESLDRAINIMRKRVDQLGVAQPEIQRTGSAEIDVSLPDVSNARRAQEQVGKTAQLHFYDWEPNVIGPEGTPAPSERRVTGGAEPASVGSGLPEYQAILRAAKRKAIIRPNDTTYEPGCTPAQVNGCIYGAWYLIDTKHEKVLCAGGKPICGPADTQAELYADGYKPPPDAKVKAVRVNPGTVLVEARSEEFNNKVTKAEPNSFYVLNDDPVLNGEDINNPTQSTQSEGGGSGAAGRHLRLLLARAQGLRRSHQADRPARPERPAAGRQQGERGAALRDRARRTGDHRALDRLHRSTPTASTRATARRSPAASRSPPRRTSPTSCSRARCRSSWN